LGNIKGPFNSSQGFKENGTLIRQVAEVLQNKTIGSGCSLSTAATQLLLGTFKTENVTSTGTTLSVYGDSILDKSTAGAAKTFNLGTLVAGVRKRILCKSASSTAWVKVYSGSTAAATFDGTNRRMKFTNLGFFDVEYLTSARYIIIGKTTSVAAST